LLLFSDDADEPTSAKYQVLILLDQFRLDAALEGKWPPRPLRELP
jgi:hypothetical protein